MKNHKRYLILAILGALIIGLAFYLFLSNYLDSKNILVFSKDIKAGKIIEEGDLYFKPYYKKTLPKNYLTEKKEIVGKVIHMDRKEDDYASEDILVEKKDTNLISNLGENEVLLAINLPSFEPILKELKVGQKISIVSSKKESNDYSGLNITGSLEEEPLIYNNDYIKQNTFILSENILLIDNQIIVRDLEILDLENVETSQNVLINDNRKDTNLYLGCHISSAPYLTKIVNDDDFKIIVEKK